MSNKVAPLRGMRDLLHDEFHVHKYIEHTAYDAAKLYGYEAISTPILEHAGIFERSLGSTSDILSKETYSFTSKGGDLVTLRPEFTAGIVRAFISNGLKHKLPLKLFSSGPVFRYDRPQQGRQRQFNQLNFEYLGAKDPYSDAETIVLAAHILENLGILHDTSLEINSLGCTQSREKYQTALADYLQGHVDDLSEDSKKRLEKNPLRILDSKSKSDKEIVKNAPNIAEYYTQSSFQYFEDVKSYLDMMEVKYTINPRLVRGLDYYSHTAFEFITEKLGTQGTVLAGGRYDGLSELMGGPKTRAIGFAAGIERIALMKDFKIHKARPIFIITISNECKNYAIKLANFMRKNNINIRLEISGKLNKHMQNAIHSDASHIIFIGESELKQQTYKLKNLDCKTEKSLTMDELLKSLTSKR